MLTAIIDLIGRAFGQRLDARLAEETATRLAGFEARIRAALAAGDVTPDGLAGGDGKALADKPKRSKS